jgi:hypothetical protein
MRTIIALFSVALIALFGCAGQPPGGLPNAVGDRYAELSSEYADGLGAILSNCTKNGERAYIVVGSAGFSGETFIYDAYGVLVRQYDWDDMVEPGETPPPYDGSVYECVVIDESKPPPPPTPPDGDGGLPRPVAERYEELAGQYRTGLGATLERCQKGGQTLFFVTGSGGFSGVTYYYDADGRFLAEYPWDDVVAPDEPPEPFPRSQYICTVLNQSKEFGPQPGEEKVQEFLDAGCTFDGEYLECTNTAIERKFGCSFGMRVRIESGNLEPPITLVQCNILAFQQNLSEQDMKNYFYCSGGLLYTCKSYVYWAGTEFAQLKNTAELAEAAGPVGSEGEAMAFVLLSKEVHQTITVDNTTFTGSSEKSGDVYLVTVYAPDRVFGCYDEVNYEEIVYEVISEGKISEKSRRIVYNDQLGYAVCVD